MFKKNLTIFLLIFSLPKFSLAATKTAQVEIWNSEEGLKRLERSHFKTDFYQLANFYQPQENPLYCALATGTIILNALNYGNIASQKEYEVVTPPELGSGIIRFPLYSQKNFLNNETELIKKRDIISLKIPNDKNIYDPGLSLADFAQILRKAYGLKVALNYAEKNDQSFIEKFRQILKKTLADKTNFVIVNMDGRILGQKTHGHISPVVAYDEESDSVLILDVALYKNQWYWADLKQLFAAMNSKDGDNYRGYLVVSKK